MATIKAGTYRFNDVLTILNPNATESTVGHLSFTCTFNIIDETTYAFSEQTYQFNQLIIDLSNSVGYWYNLEHGRYLYTQSQGWKTQYMGFTREEALVVYPEALVNLAAGVYGEGIKTITVSEDSEVSEDFYEWFTANAVEQKEISGKWKFKDYLTPISGLNESVRFTAKYSFEYEGTHSGIVSCNGLSFIEGDGYAFRVRSMFNGLSNPTDQIIAESVVGVPFPFEAAIYTEYMNGYDYGFSFISEGFDFQTIDFGTEPQIVSDEFYEWLIANATKATTITYNGSTIASLFGGDRATLKCAGMMMESDVVVEVAEI